MAKDPGIGNKIIARVIGLKGTCATGHKVGDSFSISIHNPGELCGVFYHDIFPTISVLQFGGSFPWSEKDVVGLECPDRQNVVSVKLERVKR